MQDARTRGALIALALLIFGGSGIALYATRRPAPPPVVITPAPDEAPAAPNDGGTGLLTPPELGAGGRSAPPIPKETPARIYVHVAGAVKRPSLYALAPGSRVMQAVKAAGGPAPTADLDAVNLAERVRDGEKVYIPRRQPQGSAEAAMTAPPGNTIGHVSVMPPPPPSDPTPPALGAGGVFPDGVPTPPALGRGGGLRAGARRTSSRRRPRAMSTSTPPTPPNSSGCPASARRWPRASSPTGSRRMASTALTTCKTSAASARRSSPASPPW